MVEIWIEKSDDSWFAVGAHEEKLVATAVASSKASVVEEIMRNIPAGVPRELTEERSHFARETVRMLAQLEAGDEHDKSFILSDEYLPDHLRRVLYAAAAIPIGYVTSYGNIASVAGAIARRVGRIMATNPLYPIVPCHRVVGSDMALVGYGGHQDDSALRAKLKRLKAEARGCAMAEVIVEGRPLRLYPAERVIVKAARDLPDPAHQLPLF